MDEIKLPEPVAYIGTFQIAGCKPGVLAHHTHTNLETLKVSGPHGQSVQPLFTADQLRAAVEADRERRQPTWDDLQQLAVKHGAWVSGYGPFAAELLVTYGAAPEKQPNWVQEWLNAEASVRRHHQPARKPLTDAEIKRIATYAPEGISDDDVADIVRRVERMHGIGGES